MTGSDAEVRIHSIGDSLTAGIADVCTNRRLVAWPHRLATVLTGIRLPARVTCDLAVSGAPAAEVYVEQFGRLDLRPGDLVCLWVGANDAIRRSCTYANTHAAIAAMFEQTARAGCVPLSMELPRVSEMLPGPARLMRRWDEFGGAVNELVSTLSARTGGLHLPWRSGPGMTGPDGTHLSAYGHQLYANEYAAGIAVRQGISCQAWPAVEPDEVYDGNRWPWYLRNGVPWLWRRQFDAPRVVPSATRRTTPALSSAQSPNGLDVLERSSAAGAGRKPGRSRATVGGE